LNVESQMSSLNLPDTTELRERLATVEQKLHDIGKQADAFELWVNDQLEFINEDIESVLKDPFNNPLDGNY